MSVLAYFIYLKIAFFRIKFYEYIIFEEMFFYTRVHKYLLICWKTYEKNFEFYGILVDWYHILTKYKYVFEVKIYVRIYVCIICISIFCYVLFLSLKKILKTCIIFWAKYITLYIINRYWFIENFIRQTSFSTDPFTF